MARRSPVLVVSGEPVVAVDEHSRVVSWNPEIEKLTGISAEDALGRPCWSILRGRSSQGSLLCHRDCSATRYARAGYGLPAQEMTITTASGPRSVTVSTLVLRSRTEPLLLHLVRDGSGRPAPPPGAVASRLTPRQLQVLELLAEGVTARRIATELRLAEATVRNHIRAVLRELRAHSQLEAVARAREQGLV